MAVGAFAGVAQNNIKRLMAYSSIGNMGYALMGIVAANQAGAQAVIVYMAIYMVMSAGTFGIILAMRRSGKAVESISDLAGLSRSQPVMAYAMAILMFSMAGIPPLAGFFGKMMVFQAAVSTGHFTLATLGVLSSVVAAYYYLRIIKVMFFDDPAPVLDAEPSYLRRFVVAVSLALILLFALMPNSLIDHSAVAAEALFTAQEE
jgi:NADH-quinone oxidoreductase subunit N